jgi:4-hydroxybenzoate polyprenyltransferase
MSLQEKIFDYIQLARLDKPIGILLLLWPTLWALWIASNGKPDIWILFVFVSGVILMRSAGCVINDVADRKIDPHVARTKNRPIASGRVSTKEALIFFTALCLIAFGLVLTLNKLTIYLSLIGVFLAASYPFTKRYTHLPQAYLGLAFGWAIPMAFAATLNKIPDIAWLLLIITLLWAIAYDTMYAMVDRADDLKIGVKSSAILFGRYDRLIIGLIQCLLIGLLIIAGLKEEFGAFFYAGVLIAAGFSIYQQRLIFTQKPDACFKAFLNNHWYGASIFFGLFIQLSIVQ